MKKVRDFVGWLLAAAVVLRLVAVLVEPLIPLITVLFVLAALWVLILGRGGTS